MDTVNYIQVWWLIYIGNKNICPIHRSYMTSVVAVVTVVAFIDNVNFITLIDSVHFYTHISDCCASIVIITL